MMAQWMFRANELRTQQTLGGILTVFARDPESPVWTVNFSSSAGEIVLQSPKLVFLTAQRFVADMPCPFDKLHTDLGTVRYLSLVDDVPMAGESLGKDTFMLMRRLPVSAQVVRTVIASVPVTPRART